MTKKLILIIFVSVFITNMVLADNIYLDNNFSYADIGKSVNPQFVVSVLKYEPYPVSPGESFDLWVKVQNVGQNDASNARFELQLSYPFSSNDSLERTYGKIYGTKSAYASKEIDEKSIQSNQVVIKYRIQVDNNANAATDNIKFISYSDSSSNGVITNLPIVVDKTKTEFGLELQKVGADGYSFVISNIGQEDASSLAVSINPQEGVSFNGDRIFVIGSLNAGDYTKFVAPLSVSDNMKSLDLKIDYTDSSGARRSIEKNVLIDGIAQIETTNYKVSNTYTKWIFAFVGFLIGLLAMSFVKRKQIKNLSRN